MARSAIFVGCFILLVSAESLYLLSRATASVERLLGERASLRNDLVESWNHYQRAVDWGGDRSRLETDIVELLLFGLDQQGAGIRMDMALSPETAVQSGLDLIVRRLHERPYSAYHWSLASDLCRHAARLRRRETVIDLEQLSENPMKNLLQEELLAIAALQKASDLEPNSYIYHDLLVELFLEMGAPDRAAPHCRRAVAAYPVLGEHRYLLRPDLAPELFAAAEQGFEDAAERPSMIPQAAIEWDLGRLLAMRGEDRRALARFSTAIGLAPDFYDPQRDSGSLLLRQGDYRAALERLRQAARILPEEASPHFEMGLAHRALGQLNEAIAEFRIAREMAPRNLMFFRGLADALEEAGQVEEAERQLRAAANLNPGEAEAWSSLLAFYIRRNDRRSASELCSRIETIEVIDEVSRNRCAALGQDGG